VAILQPVGKVARSMGKVVPVVGLVCASGDRVLGKCQRSGRQAPTALRLSCEGR